MKYEIEPDPQSGCFKVILITPKDVRIELDQQWLTYEAAYADVMKMAQWSGFRSSHD